METDNKGVDEMIKALWDLSNVIMAFTVAQSLAVIYFSLEKVSIVREWHDYVWLAISLILFGAAAYSAAIWACFRQERRLRERLKQPHVVIDIVTSIARARIGTVIAFNCMAAAAAVLAHVHVH